MDVKIKTRTRIKKNRPELIKYDQREGNNFNFRLLNWRRRKFHILMDQLALFRT